ncbi:MAG: hypothetical protein JNL45_05000 [Hyphomicrobium sp.]|nr:hypothetical protein [Hyphomicrobium sp.]
MEQHKDDTGSTIAPGMMSPVALSLGQPVAVAAIAALGLAGAFFFSGIGFWDPQDRAGDTRPAGGTNAPIKLSSSEVPGALTAIDKALTANSDHVFTALLMHQDQKARLKRELENSSMRIGGLTVWDTMDQDGDRIRIGHSTAAYSAASAKDTRKRSPPDKLRTPRTSSPMSRSIT